MFQFVMTKNLFPLLLLLNIFLGASGDIEGVSSVCPHEIDGVGFIGQRTSKDQCATLVFREQLFQAKGNGYSQSLANMTADYYCNEHFKSGSLLLEPDFAVADDLKLLKTHGNVSFDAFFCLHQPYANCQLKTTPKCSFDEETEMCAWAYTVDHYSAEEPPFGQSCKFEENESSACVCDPCSITEWNAWENFQNNYGVRFQTRYRPYNMVPFHSCDNDTSLCCLEYRSPDNVHAFNIGCVNGGYVRKMENATCSCHESHTGFFCEKDRYRNSENIILRLLSFTKVPTLIIALAMIITFILILISLIWCFCKDSDENDEQPPPVVINVLKRKEKSNVEINAYDREMEYREIEDEYLRCAAQRVDTQKRLNRRISALQNKIANGRGQSRKCESDGKISSFVNRNIFPKRVGH